MGLGYSLSDTVYLVSMCRPGVQSPALEAGKAGRQGGREGRRKLGKEGGKKK